MKRQSKKRDPVAAGLVVLAAVLALHLWGDRPGAASGTWNPADARVFVAVAGRVRHPGVYRFSEAPGLERILAAAGGPAVLDGSALPRTSGVFPSGSRLEIRGPDPGPPIVCGPMNAFWKTTLGIPISLNQESPEGLTVIPGIGPHLASAIVEVRNRREGFDRLASLREVSGIGERLYRKVKPYLVLK